MKFKEVQLHKKSVLIQNVSVIDVVKGKSMITFVNSSGGVLIKPYKINHFINDFTNLFNRINKLKLENISVIMESSSIYHNPIKRFFLENNFKVYTINALYSKIDIKI